MGKVSIPVDKPIADVISALGEAVDREKRRKRGQIGKAHRHLRKLRTAALKAELDAEKTTIRVHRRKKPDRSPQPALGLDKTN
jgi:hypothetical protein